MKELSLHVLDIAKNSVKAGATLIRITLEETDNTLKMTVADDGCGMREEILRGVVDPFYTTRTTRKVGMGLPLLKLSAEQTGGSLTVTSRHESEYPESHGTEVVALFYKDHIDFTPMGDIIATVITLLQGSPNIDFLFLHTAKGLCATLDTREMRQILGADIPLDSPEILAWAEDYLREQYQNRS